ncbi:hypothetical protein DPMN_058533 [Dreissena polymorpha]|uniref:Uncharacterized protein n=1 Tax=Dreissena polymorpha TaxID=45954 RepID=A0A9D4HDS6_DREPO|nr:hypothetical protein DPMN_058533 [Dreissena polymorpha]
MACRGVCESKERQLCVELAEVRGLLQITGGVRRDEPSWASRQGSVSSRQPWQGSVGTFAVMTWLGYGPDIRQSRRDSYNDTLITSAFRGGINVYYRY